MKVKMLSKVVRTVCSVPTRCLSSVGSEMQEFLNTRTVQLENGDKAQGLFSKKEMDNRVSRLRSYMESAGLKACVLTSIHNINYYSGFIYCSFSRPYALVITPDSHVTVSAFVDGGQPWRRSLQDNIIYTDWKRDNYMYAVQKLLKNVKGNIGIEMDVVPVDRYNKFQDALQGCQLHDVGVQTMKMRMVKSEEEIQVTKQGSRIACIGGEVVRKNIAEGVPEYEIAIAGSNAMTREIARTFPHIEYMDTWVWLQSGVNTDGAHNPLTSRKLQRGDILSLNCFPMIQGYYTALERTLFVEECSDAHLKIWEKVVKVHERGLELLKPGKKCSEIAHELNEVSAELDILKYRSFGYGHSFGSLCHYYGREAGLELREDIETVLEPGNIISMEPMATVPEGQPGAGGYREHDIVVIHHDGSAENITKFPYGPKHNIVKAK